MQVDVVDEAILRCIAVFPVLAGRSNTHSLDVERFGVGHWFEIEVLKIQFHVFPPGYSPYHYTAPLANSCQ